MLLLKNWIDYLKKNKIGFWLWTIFLLSYWKHMSPENCRFQKVGTSRGARRPTYPNLCVELVSPWSATQHVCGMRYTWWWWSEMETEDRGMKNRCFPQNTKCKMPNFSPQVHTKPLNYLYRKQWVHLSPSWHNVGLDYKHNSRNSLSLWEAPSWKIPTMHLVKQTLFRNFCRLLLAGAQVGWLDAQKDQDVLPFSYR